MGFASWVGIFAGVFIPVFVVVVAKRRAVKDGEVR